MLTNVLRSGLWKLIVGIYQALLFLISSSWFSSQKEMCLMVKMDSVVCLKVARRRCSSWRKHGFVFHVLR